MYFSHRYEINHLMTRGHIKIMKNQAGPAQDPWPPSQAGPAQDPRPPSQAGPAQDLWPLGVHNDGVEHDGVEKIGHMT